jgi:hypothetical protein
MIGSSTQSRRYGDEVMTRFRVAFAAALAVAPTIAVAQTPSPVFDQVNPPISSVTQSELEMQGTSVSGGTVYHTIFRGPGNPPSWAMSTVFAPVAAGGLTRNLILTDAKSDLGVALTATPTAGAVGVTRVAGASLVMTGEATSASAKTDKALFEFNLPDSFKAGSNIAVTVNCLASGGTITAASTTLTLAAYTETNGVEAPLAVTAAQQIPSTATNLTYTITGTALTPGQHMAIELTMLVTSSVGAATGVINGVSYGG